MNALNKTILCILTGLTLLGTPKNLKSQEKQKKQFIGLSQNLEQKLTNNSSNYNKRIKEYREGLGYYALMDNNGIRIIIEKDKSILSEVQIDSSQFEIIKRLYNPEEIPNFNLFEDYGIDTTNNIDLLEFNNFFMTVEEDSNLINEGLNLTEDMKDKIKENIKFADKNSNHFLLALNKFKDNKDNFGLYTGLWYLSHMKDHKFVYKEGEEFINEFDLNKMDAITFYENIFYPLKEKKESQWTTSWDDFFKFTLSNRITQEPLTRWRAHFYNAIVPVIKNKFKNKKEAAKYFNQLGNSLTRFMMTSFEDFNAYGILATNAGRCEELTSFTSYFLATVGGTPMHVYTPVWSKIDGNHAWLGEGTKDEFLSLDGCIPQPNDPLVHIGKTFAKVYGLSPFGEMKDLTKEYTRTAVIKLEGLLPNSLYFLNVFNFGDWREVNKQKANENGYLILKDVGCNEPILYAITSNKLNYYTQEDPILVHNPFILNPDSTVTELSLTEDNLQEIEINPRDKESFPDAFSWFNINDTTSFNNSSYTLMHTDSIGWENKGNITVTNSKYFKFNMAPNTVYSIYKNFDGKNNADAVSRPLILIKKGNQYSIEEF